MASELIADFLNNRGLQEKDLADYLAGRGWGIEHPSTFRIDLEPEFLEIWETVQPYTMISAERGYAVYQAVCHVLDRGIPGDFVECGVWKGGTCMLMALTLIRRGCRDRRIWLYDTFSGMTEPGPEDRIASSGEPVSDRWHEGWWAVGTGPVREHLLLTGYPEERFQLVPGDVCRTLTEQKPSEVSLLRLDTDWYESTLAELEQLYPALVPGGALIIDDYGHFSGSRRAVEEYFRDNPPRPFLQRSDYTGRIALKRG